MASRKPTGKSRTAKLLGAGARTLGRNIISRLPGGDRIEKRAQYWASIGEDWAGTLEQMRGAAMKLGQMAAQYSDLFPDAFTTKLARLQKDAEPIAFDQIEDCLSREWTTAQRARVTEIEPTALAAASIGQVHRARLRDGRPVVLKVRYPGVHEAVEADLDQMRRLFSLSRALPMDKSSISRLLEELRARFREETDYRCELCNLQYLRRHCTTPGIVYPQPVRGLCTGGVLVLSEESGAPLSEARAWPQALRDRLGTHLLQWLSHSVFIGRAVHADPHPGNFTFRRDGDIVVYDYGCVKRLERPTALALCALLEHARNEDWRAIHDTMNRLGGLSEQARFERLEPLYAELTRLTLKPVRTARHFDFADDRYVPEIRASLRRHLGHSLQFRPISELVFVTRALSGLYWILRTLECRVAVGAIILGDAERCKCLDDTAAGAPNH